MRGEYFQHLPKVMHNGKRMRNILIRAKLTSDAIQSASSFYPYVVKEGDTPWTIAHVYYGSVAYVWAVLMSNSMIDPYHEWPLTSPELEGMITKKYGSMSQAMAAVVEYRGATRTISPLTFQMITPEERMNFVPVTAFDREFELNERRRSIQLLDNTLVPIIENQLRTIFSATSAPPRSGRSVRVKPEAA